MSGRVPPGKVGSFTEVAVVACGGITLSQRPLVCNGQGHHSAVAEPLGTLWHLIMFILSPTCEAAVAFSHWHTWVLGDAATTGCMMC